MVERHRQVLGLGRLAEELVPVEVARPLAPGVQVGNLDGRLDGRQAGTDLGHGVCPVDGGGSVSIAVDGEQHLWLDLSQTIEHGLRAELRGTHHPCRAETRSGEQRDQGLLDVRRVGGDAVTRSDAPVAPIRYGLARPCHAVRPNSIGKVRGSASSRRTAGDAPVRRSVCSA